jgi:hypothetical protein
MLRLAMSKQTVMVKWAIEPGHVGAIEYIEGLPKTLFSLPHEGDVLTLPFMVDPLTRRPCAVRVTRLVPILEGGEQLVAIVVVRAQQD